METLTVHYTQNRLDPNDSYTPVECEAKEHPLWWQAKGLSFTASGYGSRIPTRNMVKFQGRWRRVYCCIHSNIGACFIGPSVSAGFLVTN